jgi:voltage-dependent calcium channel alpha-2/delta-4
MLITDGVASNDTQVFEKYNWFELDSEDGANKTVPVRIFTYLLGKEVTKVKEIQNYACLNRGYYSHIQTIDEVAEGVLKYVNVIASPLVLQKVDHPPTWTHAFIDEYADTETDAVRRKEEKTRLMIAVGAPAFDQVSYYDTNSTGPQLLGVAGTNIPLDDLNKLALPYKLGVNGYAFIVSNNGYVLLHPDLRPFDDENLKENYNSIDLTEVEQFEDDKNPREPSKKLRELRENMVMGIRGLSKGIPVKFHYDNMMRVDHSKQDFYFAPIPHTPFSLGIGK